MAPTRSPAETARTALELARAGRFADLRELFAPALRDMVPPEALQAAWEAALSRQGGPVIAAGPPVTEPGPSGTEARIPVTLQHGTMTVAIGMAGEHNWVTGVPCCPAARPGRRRPGSRRPTPTRPPSPSRTSWSATASWPCRER
jgi:hypothetical protein